MAQPRPYRSGGRWTVSGALVAGAVALATNIEITLHEVGHLVANRVLGAEAGINLHPFAPSGTTIAGPLPAGYGWAVAAGPVVPIVVGSIAPLVARRSRRPGFLAITLFGPMALLLEGANALVQLVERTDGTDITVLSEIALPEGVIGTIAAVVLAAGFVSLSATMPLAGLAAADPAMLRWATPLAGFSVDPLVGAAWVALAGGDVARNLGLTAFGVVTGLVVAALHPAIAHRAGLEPVPVRPATAWGVVAGAVTLAGMMTLVG